MTEVDLEALLAETNEHLVGELARMPDVEPADDDLKVGDIPGSEGERLWLRLPEVVAVVADLKSSTQLGLRQKAPSTASIYEASTGNVAKIFDQFDSNFMAIQGDGAFALFWGDRRKERALCAAITVHTFGERQLAARLKEKWGKDEDFPDTGLKVGVAHSPLLVRKVGIESSGRQEPVWAGRAVNYAAKCAQQADKGELIVTGSIWSWVLTNHYLAASCGCPDGVPSTNLWEDEVVTKIPDFGKGKGEREGKKLRSLWCENHGAEFCSAVLGGKSKRDGVESIVTKSLEIELSHPARREAYEYRKSAGRRDQMEALGRHMEQSRRVESARQSGLRKIGQ